MNTMTVVLTVNLDDLERGWSSPKVYVETVLMAHSRVTAYEIVEPIGEES